MAPGSGTAEEQATPNQGRTQQPLFRTGLLCGLQGRINAIPVDIYFTGIGLFTVPEAEEIAAIQAEMRETKQKLPA